MLAAIAALAGRFPVLETELSAAAIVACLLGGLGVFLLGMKQISEGLQGVAGARRRKLGGAGAADRPGGGGARTRRHPHLHGPGRAAGVGGGRGGRGGGGRGGARPSRRARRGG